MSWTIDHVSILLLLTSIYIGGVSKVSVTPSFVKLRCLFGKANGMSGEMRSVKGQRPVLSYNTTHILSVFPCRSLQLTKTQGRVNHRTVFFGCHCRASLFVVKSSDLT